MNVNVEEKRGANCSLLFVVGEVNINVERIKGKQLLVVVHLIPKGWLASHCALEWQAGSAVD